jgi:chromosome segregation ATPase
MAATTTATAAPPPDPLDDLKQQVQQQQTTIAVLTAGVAILTKDIAELDKNSKEIKQAPVAYGQAKPGFDKTQQQLDSYIKPRWSGVQSDVGDYKARIEETIKKFDDTIDELVKQVANDVPNNLRENNEKAADAYNKAAATLADKTKTFQDSLTYQKRLEQKFKDLNDAKAKADREDAARHTASFYFLIKDMSDGLSRKLSSGDDPIEPAELQTELSASWSEFISAKDDLRDKKTKADRARLEFEAAQKTLGDLRQKRQETLLAKMSEFDQEIEHHRATQPDPHKPPAPTYSAEGTAVQPAGVDAMTVC